jgi:hypothetical protein
MGYNIIIRVSVSSWGEQDLVYTRLLGVCAQMVAAYKFVYYKVK